MPPIFIHRSSSSRSACWGRCRHPSGDQGGPPLQRGARAGEGGFHDRSGCARHASDLRRDPQTDEWRRANDRSAGIAPSSSFRGPSVAREPGIHIPKQWLWIPGSRLTARPGMTAAEIRRTRSGHTRAVSYSALMPFSRISLPQRVISSRRWRPNSSGELGDGVTPASASSGVGLRIIQHRREGRAEPGDHRRRGARRRQQSGPLVGDRVGEALLDEGRNVRERARAIVRRGGQRLELAGLHLGDDGRDVAEQSRRAARRAGRSPPGMRRDRARLELDAGRAWKSSSPRCEIAPTPVIADGDAPGRSRASAASSRAEFTCMAAFDDAAWSS